MAEVEDSIAIVLAAGRGTRMGSPKALMLVDGEPWWRRQLDRLESAGVRSCWVVSDEVEYAMAREDDAPILRVRASSDEPMFASVLAGVRALTDYSPRSVFILPIDTPAPTRRVWVDCAGAGAVSAPVFNGRHGHPLHLPWGWVQQNLLEPAPDPASARLDLLIRDSITHIPTDDSDTVMNLNNPDDLRLWLNHNRSST